MFFLSHFLQLFTTVYFRYSFIELQGIKLTRFQVLFLVRPHEVIITWICGFHFISPQNVWITLIIQGIQLNFSWNNFINDLDAQESITFNNQRLLKNNSRNSSGKVRTICWYLMLGKFRESTFLTRLSDAILPQREHNFDLQVKFTWCLFQHLHQSVRNHNSHELHDRIFWTDMCTMGLIFAECWSTKAFPMFFKNLF